MEETWTANSQRISLASTLQDFTQVDSPTKCAKSPRSLSSPSYSLIHGWENGILHHQQDTGGASRRIRHHWRVPIILLTGLSLGFLFALAHHELYAYYHGKPVRGSIGQQWVNRIGTAFAFIVKTALAVSAGAAYVQRQWYKFGSKSHRVIEIDSVFGILNDATFFLDRIWFSNILLAVIAAVTWLLPFAAVITPASLTVDPEMQVEFIAITPAQLHFNYSNFAVVQHIGGNYYRGASNEVSRIAVAAATAGQVLQISSLHPNESYSLQFFGPAITCTSNQEQATAAAAKFPNHDITEDPLVFVSWVPSDTNHGAPDYDFINSEAYDTIEKPKGNETSSAFRLFFGTASDYGDLVGDNSSPFTVQECVLHNASYTADFEFQYPQQTVTLRSLQIKETIVEDDVAAIAQAVDGDMHASRLLSYKAVMDAFGSVFVGGRQHDHYGSFLTFGGTRYSQTKVDWQDPIGTRQSLEILFQNITLSMLSSSQLAQNSTFAESVSAQVTTYPNTYVYSAQDLWLSYGIAIGATMICVAFGFEAIIHNKATYSNRFSTILRTTRNQKLDELVHEDDDGSNPLPKRIANAQLSHEGQPDRTRHSRGWSTLLSPRSQSDESW